jgi:hypothetical protein
MNDDYFPQNKGYAPKKFSKRVDVESTGPVVPTYCGEPNCMSVWHPAKDGRAAHYTKGFADIAVHLHDRTIYRCQKCYYDTLVANGKSQHQIAAAEYAKKKPDLNNHSEV